jgi:thioredoxin-related protein
MISRLASWVFAAALCLAVGAAADDVTVPIAVDLQSDGYASEERGIPILLVFTREDCGYCELLKRSVIRPMILSGEYDERVLIREVIVDDPNDIKDFGGRTVNPFAVANRYDGLLTPTVLMVGPEGQALAERLIGISNEQMYLWYLDRALAEATRVLRGS